jgi:hypothetical protein
MEYMGRKLNELRQLVSLPSGVFALSFVLLGWIASHSIAYALVDLLPHGHHDYHGEQHMHGYMGVLKLTGGIGLVLAFSLALRAFFRHGSFGEWLREGGLSGTRKQVALATIPPTAVFVLVEHLERMAAETGTSPSTRLLVVGIVVQLVVGLLCLMLVRVTFRVAERVIGFLTQDLLVWQDRRAAGPLILRRVFFAHSLCPMADSAAGRAPPLTTVSFWLFGLAY